MVKSFNRCGLCRLEYRKEISVPISSIAVKAYEEEMSQ